MCKYCSYDNSISNSGECANSVPTVGKIDMGNLHVELIFNRYECGETNNKELILELNADTDCGYANINEKHIEIKYCPFCGEKL